MLSATLRRSEKDEKAQLLFLGLGLGAVAAVVAWAFDARVFAGFLTVLALAALAGWIAYRRIGHDVYLVFALIALAIGRILSPIVVFIMYLASIVLVGAALRVFGVNLLKRNFRSCKQQPTMLVDSSVPSVESFRRQS